MSNCNVVVPQSVSVLAAYWNDIVGREDDDNNDD